MDGSPAIRALLASDEPSIRFLVRRDVLGEDEMSPACRRERAAIPSSARVTALLDGHARLKRPTYAKWQGAHWVALALAELAHPGGDARVTALVDEVLDHWTAPQFLRDRPASASRWPRDAVPIVAGKARRCGSQHGAALLVATRLGAADDERASTIARRLTEWQWPDGGWNCDRRPVARTSSVNETLLPLRGLASFAARSAEASVRAAREYFLERNVAFRRTTGEPIAMDVMRLHHPVYWHFDLLAGLGALAETGGLDDPRCQRALDVLESRRGADGMWRADARYYRLADHGSNVELVDWGPVGTSRPNAWVTLRPQRADGGRATPARMTRGGPAIASARRMINRDNPQGPGQGPLDRPSRDAGDPIGDDAYPGGSGMLPPTADMDDPIPETGMPGEPRAEPDQLEEEEELGPEDEPLP